MYSPTREEFLKLAKQGNVVPVYGEVSADTDTPVSAFLKIESENCFLLESVEGGEKIARYSFLGADPSFIFQSKGEEGDPFAALEELLKKYKPVKNPDLPRFQGGLVGYIGYDSVRFIESRLERIEKKKDDLGLPDIQLFFADTILAFDHLKHKIFVISCALIEDDAERAYQAATKKIDALVKKLSAPVKERAVKGKLGKVKPVSNMTPEKFCQIVEKAKEYIAAGDIIQTVPSQRFATKIKTDPFNIYRALRSINPSPYMYYLKMGDLKIVGSSPEVMVRLEEGIATVRPIAGTRRRDKDKAEDKKLEKELLADEKERAEHLMLVDLGRNDLGRVCEYKSVKATEMMVIERYSHVMHIVSNICGKLKSGMSSVDLFEASFPAGTVSGAPKIRAMEIIDELEPTRRGIYAGAIGYFSFSGNLDTCIAIRTIVIKGNDAYIQAGAGIVADSVPEKEYQETVNKAQAMLKAIEEAHV